MRKIIWRSVPILLITVFFGCKPITHDKTVNMVDRDMKEANTDTKYNDMWYIINHVIGNDEKDTIVGNFTGHGIDTLFIKNLGKKTENDYTPYIVTSTNKNIPSVHLYGCEGDIPGLVNEGDLDENGTCEFGYIHTWDVSQWRTYRVFTLVDGKWRYLIDPCKEYMETGKLIRGSGKEILEPSSKKGWIKVNYQTQGVNEMIKDTIVKPDYTRIDD